MNVPKWPNPANRIFYPSPVNVIHARKITKPDPLEQSILDEYSTFNKKYDDLSKVKEGLEEKIEKLLSELEVAQNGVKTAWSRNSSSKSLVTRLTADLELIKKELAVTDTKIDDLTEKNNTIISLVSVHDSCVKGYDEYIIWKEETNRKIHEAYLA